MKPLERVMIVHPGPDFSVADVFTGWMEAFSGLGYRTIDYNLGDRLAFYFAATIATGNVDEDGRPEFKRAFPERDDCIQLAVDGLGSAFLQFWPQLVIIISSFFITPRMIAVLRDRGACVVVIQTECPYEDERQLKIAEWADLNLLNDKVTIDKYRELAPAYYMPHAYRPGLHYPGPGDPEYASDFCFVGTGYPSRWDFFHRMHDAGGFDGLDPLFAGNWGRRPEDEESPLTKWLAHDPKVCFDNEQTAQVYRAGKTGLNFYRREGMHHSLDNGGWSMGPREVEMSACGLFFLRDSRGESNAILPMLPTFATPEDAADQLQWWAHHDKERDEAARAARAAIRGRTFENNAKMLLSMLEMQD